MSTPRNRFLWIGLPVVVLAVATGIAFVYRGDLRTWWSMRDAEPLPAAQAYHPSTSTANTSDLLGVQDSATVEGGVATSEHYVMVSSPPTTPKDPPKPAVAPVASANVPAAVNLAVPFTSQAPLGDWSMPYQEACEEASAIMVDAFYQGKTGTIAPNTAKQAIDNLVAFETKQYGGYKDTDAEQTARFIREYFHYKTVLVEPLTSVDDIKAVLAKGYPVMVPADGKLIPNPNYKNGGPAYHMLVIKGYTKDRFITNDSGTHAGADYTYTYAALMNAAHDWNGGDVIHGKSVMIVVMPNP